MPLREDTSRTLAVLAAVLLVLGLVVGSPGGRLFLLVLALPAAAVAAAFGRPRSTRLVAAVLLAAAAALCVATYPAGRDHMDAYRSRARRGTSPAPAAPGGAPPPAAPSAPPSAPAGR